MLSSQRMWLRMRQHAPPMAIALRCMGSSSASVDHKAPVIPAPPKRVSITNLVKFKKTNRPIVMVTAYDYPSAVQADLAGVDVILVGDSVGVCGMCGVICLREGCWVIIGP